MVREYSIDRPAIHERQDREREFLAGEALPTLADELDRYMFLDYSDKAGAEFTKAQQNPDRGYGLPYLTDVQQFFQSEMADLLPEYFIAADGATEEDIRDGDYAVAVEPENKVTELKDDAVYDAVLDFAEQWEAETQVDETPEVTILRH